MSDNPGGDIPPIIDIIIEQGYSVAPQRMIIVKQLCNGDIHAETNSGEMIIIRTDGTVKSFLEDDEDWVIGKLENFGQAWEVIGFHFNMTNGHNMERTRNERGH
jgi:hypothetical protein